MCVLQECPEPGEVSRDCSRVLHAPHYPTKSLATSPHWLRHYY